jgi:hypothetical protein
MRKSEAFIEGLQAGNLLLPAGVNKYEPGTPEHAEWERGRLAAAGERLEHVADAARKVA